MFDQPEWYHYLTDLSRIAEDYGVPMQSIRETNQLNSDTIRVGQTLRIPAF